jgi:hypothetical protein
MSTTHRSRDLCGTLGPVSLIVVHPGCGVCRHEVRTHVSGDFRIWTTFSCSPVRELHTGWSCERCFFSGLRRPSFDLAMADALEHICAPADAWADLLELAGLVAEGKVRL